MPGSPGRDGSNGRNGRNGTDGEDGSPGTDGSPGSPGISPTVARTTNGVRITDAAGNRAVVADGEDGSPGSPGKDGSDGSNGSDGSVTRTAVYNQNRAMFRTVEQASGGTTPNNTGLHFRFTPGGGGVVALMVNKAQLKTFLEIT